MNDLKRTVRETEADLTEGLRRAAGHESLSDKAANVGDRLGNAVKDASDAIHEEADELSRDAAYEAGRRDEAMRR